ncbi:MAG: thioredoxin family protein [candidate division KSB1 bacterium]|nr:thioredoxin family protein [candidate division KSB1 bacterium]
MRKYILSVLFVTIGFWGGCERGQAEDPKPGGESKALVTFIELGSVNCIPCKAMQPVMKAIEEEYGDQIKIVFHDVWKDPAPAKQYGIRLIPTQVFLDDKGVEFHRHEGFYAKEEIDKVLAAKGLKPRTKS